MFMPENLLDLPLTVTGSEFRPAQQTTNHLVVACP
jgi:hypothetical protein